MTVLREFLYRRDDLVSQFLEQIEGGAYDEEQITERTQSGSGVGGSVGISGAQLSANRKKQAEREAGLTLRQTAASRFNRLHQLLDQRDDIQVLEALDDAIWDQLRNEVVEAFTVCQLGEGVADMANAGAAAGIAPLIEIMKSLPKENWPDDFDPREADRIQQQLPVVEKFAAYFEGAPVPCTFAVASSPRYRFFAELPREHLLVAPSALQGEVTLLAKIQRFIDKGAPETVGTGVLPNVAPNRAARRSRKTTEPFTTRLSYPAAVVTVIALYR